MIEPDLTNLSTWDSNLTRTTIGGMSGFVGADVSLSARLPIPAAVYDNEGGGGEMGKGSLVYDLTFSISQGTDRGLIRNPHPFM